MRRRLGVEEGHRLGLLNVEEEWRPVCRGREGTCRELAEYTAAYRRTVRRFGQTAQMQTRGTYLCRECAVRFAQAYGVAVPQVVEQGVLL